jgi:hypothetical protein
MLDKLKETTDKELKEIQGRIHSYIRYVNKEMEIIK